jgi:hypothetical protein
LATSPGMYTIIHIYIHIFKHTCTCMHLCVHNMRDTFLYNTCLNYALATDTSAVMSTTTATCVENHNVRVSLCSYHCCITFFVCCYDDVLTVTRLVQLWHASSLKLLNVISLNWKTSLHAVILHHLNNGLIRYVSFII